VAAQPDTEARQGAAALCTKGESALPTGVPMTKLNDCTWGRPATRGERQRRAGRGGWQREATSGATPLSPSYGVASSTTARRRGASNNAAWIGADAASDMAVRTGVVGVGNFYTGKQL
jgi:hypothetical protein